MTFFIIFFSNNAHSSELSNVVHGLFTGLLSLEPIFKNVCIVDYIDITNVQTFVSVGSKGCVCTCVKVVIVRRLFLPARRYASAGNSVRNVSVTRRYCVKTKA